MDIAKRLERGGHLLERMLGPDQAEAVRASWHHLCPQFEEWIIEFVAGEVWSRPQLDLRTRSLVSIATLCGMGRTLALDLNIRMALNNGASRQDIVETLLQIAPYAGFPACWEGLAAAQRIFTEIDQGKE